MLARIGAYWLEISSVASVRPFLPSFSATTCPTSTPQMRTSDCSASASERGNADRELVPFGFSGTGPPKDSHRNSSSPKQLSTNRTITRMLPSVGARFCMV